MHNNLIITQAKEAHYEDVRAIAINAWTPIKQAAYVRLGYDIATLNGSDWQTRLWSTIKERMDSHCGFVALMDGKVAGFVTWRKADCGGNMAQIGYNAVNPEYKGMGIGTKMYDFVLKVAKAEGYRYAKVHTDLDEMHAPARRSYYKAGFECGLPEIIYYMRMDQRPQIEINPDVTMVSPREEHFDDIMRIAVMGWQNIRKEQKKLLGEEIYDLLFTDWQTSKCNAVKGALQKEDRGYVALINGKVAGFVTWLSSDGCPILGTIGNNAVSPEFTGRGVGTAMYSYVLDRMERCGIKYVNVTTGLDDGHAAARHTYEKIGFDRKISTESINYYMKLK